MNTISPLPLNNYHDKLLKGRIMKKSLFIIVPLALFTFLYLLVNRQTPKNMEIHTYHEGEIIECNNCEISVRQKDLIDQEYFSIMPIEYNVKNNNQNAYDCSDILFNMIFHNGYGESVAQNINYFPDDFPQDQIPHPYDLEYELSDFIVNPGETKDFTLYYAVNRDELKNYPTCIKLANNLYKDTYNNKLENGTFYYEIIDLGLVK